MDAIQAALIHLASPWSLLLIAVGVASGVLVGATPGLTGAMLIALSLPLTYDMAAPDALTLLVSMYVGSISGGLITATLLRMPGTPASVMTTLDGYPLAQQGRPGRALGLGVGASFAGGVVSWLFLALLAQPMAELANGMTKFEFFSLIVMALVLIASVSGRSLWLGLLSGALGMLTAMPGLSPADGKPRWTFGWSELNGGLELLPVLIGLFAVSQALRDIVRIEAKPQAVEDHGDSVWLSLSDWRRHGGNMFRSSLIGSWIGILPGVGANIGSVLAYSAARFFSSSPEKFGHGAEEGIVASESGNNATVGGALIPLISMGVPGSVIDAILLGALVIHRITPGPLLFRNNPELVYTIIIATLLANIFMFGFMTVSARSIARLAAAPRPLLLPVIFVFCIVGSYALNNRMFDVWVMLAFGAIGFAMERFSIPLAPFVIGLVLAPEAEKNLAAGLQLHGGDYLPLFTERLSPFFLLLALALAVAPIWFRWRTRAKD